MQFTGLPEVTGDAVITRAKGPVGLIIAEDDVEVEATIRHHAGLGFSALLLFAPPELTLADAVAADVIRVDYPTMKLGATVDIVNAVCAALPEKTWLYYCYNAEFLYFPFCETRTVGELERIAWTHV